MRCEFNDIRFNSTVAEPSGFNSRCKRAMLQTAIHSFILSLMAVVQCLRYMTLTHEIRVQFPARVPCFRQPSTPLF